VDAVSRIARVLWALFPDSLLFKVVPALFFLLGVILTLFLPEHPEPGSATGIAFVYLVAAASFLLSATSNLSRYCEAAGALGVPGHAHAVRQAQLVMLAVFVGLPGAAVLMAGAKPLGSLALLLGGSAVAAVPLLMLPVYLALFILNNVPGARHAVLGSPWVQVGIALCSVGVFYHWVQLPLVIEARAGYAGGRVPHWHHGHMLQPPVTGPATLLEQTAGSLLTPNVLSSRPVTLLDLGVGLGVNTAFRWGFVLALSAAGWLLVLVGYSGLVALSARNVYRLMALACAVHAGLRIFLLHQAWESNRVEEEVLSLTPRWPQGMRFKWLLLRTALAVQLEGWCSLLALTLLGLLSAWLRPRDLQIAGLLVGAATLAATPMFLLAAVLPARRGLPLGKIACCVCCAAGTLLYLLCILAGKPLFARALWWAAGLLVTPVLGALALFFSRRVCFPSQRMESGRRRRVRAIFT
jgi:hypothetical protein